MVNGEKVILMTKASLYEKKETSRNLKIVKYFRHDYISLQLLIGCFLGSISFALCFVLYCACNAEHLMKNLHKMDLKGFGITLLTLYVCVMAVYLCIIYGVSAYRFHMAKKGAGSYLQILRKLSEFYMKEEKNEASGILTEETAHDRFT